MIEAHGEQEMTVTGSALSSFDLMVKRTRSYSSRHPQSTAAMKARQSAKIREIADALISEGFFTLDAQAKALGLCRSTTWTILKASHKSTGLSAKIIDRILEGQLPPLVRAKILEYVEEKAIGCYGHSERLRRKFITLLLAKRVQQTDLEEIFRLPAEARIARIATALGPGPQSAASAASTTYARPRPVARGSKQVGFARKLPRSRGVL
jgi:hypothetical protein